MTAARRLAVFAGSLIALAACSSGDESAELTIAPPVATSAAPTTVMTSTTAATSTTTTTAPATTTTTTIPPICVVTVEPGDSLGAISARTDGVSLDDLQAENGLTIDTVIHPGDELDICIGNDVDDVTGASRLPPDAEVVMLQQEHLNDLFAPYSIAELAVDGDSGPLTRQLLCAARRGVGARASTLHMQPGTPESDAVLDADEIRIPEDAPTGAERWILIDKTCQVLITGEGADRIVDVFPTSTGEPGFETQRVRTRAFRFDPALDNGGWHDSSSFPVAIDNPLNGNMYKPLYFNGGQAIHGANVIPPDPRSKGCARTFPWHQDRIIEWLALGDITEATWNEGRLDVTVAVVGDYRSKP